MTGFFLSYQVFSTRGDIEAKPKILPNFKQISHLGCCSANKVFHHAHITHKITSLSLYLCTPNTCSDNDHDGCSTDLVFTQTTARSRLKPHRPEIEAAVSPKIFAASFLRLRFRLPPLSTILKVRVSFRVSHVSATEDSKWLPLLQASASCTVCERESRIETGSCARS